jgi:GT2 family glycosyltransferase
MLEKQYSAIERGKFKTTARQFYTGNTSLPRHILLISGGFDERFRRAEDIELAYRLSQQEIEFMFTITAVGYHYAERSFSSWIQTPYSYGRHDITFSREGQEHIMDFVNEEFSLRNRLTRLTVKICLDRPHLSTIIQSTAKWIADISYKTGTRGKKISQVAYSAIFNLRYYQGIADELGGRDVFFGNMNTN